MSWERIYLRGFKDYRGVLEVLEPLPFAPKRIFTVRCDTPQRYRGGHALKTCELLIVPTSGYIRLWDGILHKAVEPGEAVHVKPMTWVQYCFGDGGGSAVVLASELFDADGYIMDRAEVG